MDKLMRVLMCACVAVVCWSADPLVELRTTFTRDGVPLHPGIIQLFSNWISDSPEPQIREVDLGVCINSNRFMAAAHDGAANGWIRRRPDSQEDHSEFGYRFIGSLQSGTIVLHVYESGGGSGVFEQALLLTTVMQPSITTDGQPSVYQALRVARVVILGDRVGASFRLAEEHVVISFNPSVPGGPLSDSIIMDPVLQRL